MPTHLHTSAPDFSAQLTAFAAAKRERDADVAAAVEAIVADVRDRGDAALLEYTARFDRVERDAAGLSLSPDAIDAAAADCPADVVAALEQAAARITAYHDTQLPQDRDDTDASGMRLGWRWRPVDAAGLYVPGGTAAYPSSVLMNAIPARVAGVERLVMAVPTPDGTLNPAVMAAARIAGVDAVHPVGGAQAVAALAYGTESIAPVDVIVGPGNAYVAAAKRRVYGTVGIDMIAGPSEILVVADAVQRPAWIAADLLSQAEHDTAARAVLLTDDAAFAEAVEAEIAALLTTLPRGNIAAASWEQYGGVILVEDIAAEAPGVINRLAPEHLELAVADPDALLPDIRHAGAIFLGSHTPEAIGDYIAGPSHVLPTAGAARFASGLSVMDFLKRTSLIGCSPAALAALAPAAETLAAAEGLHAHALSLSVRREGGRTEELKN